MADVAHNTNNTTIRSILQVEKLTRPNFTNWYRNLRIVLRSEGKLAHLEQPLIPLPLPAASQAMCDTYEVLFDAQNEVACPMLGSMSPDLQRTLENYKAYDMIQELKTMFEEQANHKFFKIVKAFHAYQQEDGQFVSAYVLKMKGYLDILEHIGHVMPNELGVSLILNSVNKDYDQFVQNYNMHSMGKSIVKLHDMLKLHAKGILKKAETLVVLAVWEGKIQKDKKKKPQGEKGKDKGKNTLAYAPKPNIPPPPKRDNPENDFICHHCKEVGHYRRNCSSYHAELKKIKNSSGASTSSIFTIELYAFSNKTCVYDTDCGTHICNTSQGLRESKKLKHGALSSYMGNGLRSAVKAIGCCFNFSFN
ncbi:zinc finger, CCHC-type containing protein [Tanacetum coccineum]